MKNVHLNHTDRYLELYNYLDDGIRNHNICNYVYGYPSKRTYRAFETPVRTKDLLIETKNNPDINIYIHIPFCRYRCTYCTLFLTTKHNEDLLEQYVNQLIRHILFFSESLKDKSVVSIYFGGGTPTILSEDQFTRIFSAIRKGFINIKPDCEITVESSPDSINLNYLNTLKSLGVNRFSLGIQTMNEFELAHCGRPYGTEVALRAISEIAEVFDHINLDLIYGLNGQTLDNWEYSLNKLLEFKPTTLSLYPVVSRPLTQISKEIEKSKGILLTNKEKFDVYDYNIEKLAHLGYRQESFTRFTRLQNQAAYYQESSDFGGTPLLGFGTGARSYFGKYHFTTEYAIGKQSALTIIQNFCNYQFDPDNLASHGIILNENEQKRRYIILNLTLSGLEKENFKFIFNENIDDIFDEELQVLSDCGLISMDQNRIYLTRLGFKHSSMLAKIFFSKEMIKLEDAYQPI